MYLERGKTLRDSPRFRRRLYRHFAEMNLPNESIGKLIEAEAGAHVPVTYGAYWFQKFFEETEPRDLLDAITLIYRYTTGTPYRKLGQDWLDFVARAMAEENLGYRLDERGGVHFAIDEEFERSRVASIATLGAPRYKAALIAFEEAHRHLDADPPDTKAAVRSLFDAVENLFKQICPRAPKIGGGEISQWLVPVVASIYPDRAAAAATSKLLSSLAQWVDAAHNYRHAPGTAEPAPPPVGLAVLMVSEGAAFLRWLVDLDQAASSPSKAAGS